MLEAQEREIDGLKYTYQPLMLKPARALFDKLVQRFGPAISMAIERLTDAEVTEDMPLEEALGHVASSAGGLIKGVVNGLDSKTHNEIADIVAKQTTVDMENNGNMMPLTDARELLFGCNLLTEFKVIAFALEVQFADFLEPMRNLSQVALAFRAKAGLRSDSRKESTGTYTESRQAQDTPTA